MSETEGINISNATTPMNVWTMNKTGSAPYLSSSSLTIGGPGWMIVGKPTLRQLLRYWWHNRKR